jgi:hypothetical protein
MPTPSDTAAPPLEDVVLDIPYANLHEWCIQRKLMSPNWRKLLQETQAQVKAALASLPDIQGVSAIKSISKLDYYQCKQVVDALSKDTTTNKRSWLGKYVKCSFSTNKL